MTSRLRGASASAVGRGVLGRLLNADQNKNNIVFIISIIVIVFVVLVIIVVVVIVFVVVFVVVRLVN